MIRFLLLSLLVSQVSGAQLPVERSTQGSVVIEKRKFVLDIEQTMKSCDPISSGSYVRCYVTVPALTARSGELLASGGFLGSSNGSSGTHGTPLSVQMLPMRDGYSVLVGAINQGYPPTYKLTLAEVKPAIQKLFDELKGSIEVFVLTQAQ